MMTRTRSEETRKNADPLICSQCGRQKLRKICTTRTELLNKYIFYRNFYCKSHATDCSPSSTTLPPSVQHNIVEPIKDNDYSPLKRKPCFLDFLSLTILSKKVERKKEKGSIKMTPNLDWICFLFWCFSRATRERMRCACPSYFHVDWLFSGLDMYVESSTTNYLEQVN